MNFGGLLEFLELSESERRNSLRVLYTNLKGGGGVHHRFAKAHESTICKVEQPD